MIEKFLGLEKNDYHPLAWIRGEPKIGKNVWIGPFCVIDGTGGLEIGDNVDIAAGAQILTHDTVRRCLGVDEEITKTPTKIGRNVFIGANAVILRGCKIGDYAVVGAGAVVLSGTEVPKFKKALGNPATIQ